MKILGVGFAGYIGGYMTDLLSKEHQVVVYDNLVREHRFMKDVPFICGDIRDTKKLSELLPQYDCVIWLAGIVGDGACAADPVLTREINTDAVKWLADNFKGLIVFPSTCSVYGKNDNILDEDSPVNPLSVYAATKLEAEQYLRKHRPDSLIFRLGTLFGVGDAHSRIRLDLVANVLSMKAARGEILTVFSGNQWRPLLHVRDVANATAFALHKQITGLYNLTYRNYLLKDMAEEIISTIPGAKVEYSEMPFEDQRNYRVKGDKFWNLGWKPQFDLANGVKQIERLIVESRIKDTTDPMYSNAADVATLYKGLIRPITANVGFMKQVSKTAEYIKYAAEAKGLFNPEKRHFLVGGLRVKSTVAMNDLITFQQIGKVIDGQDVPKAHELPVYCIDDNGNPIKIANKRFNDGHEILSMS